MAHFAELDDSNVVLRVIVVANEHEADGENWCAKLLGGRWKQTSYTARIRKNYAGVGFSYDAARDAFLPAQPFPSWLLDEETCRWQPPSPYPSDGLRYSWDEETQTWQAR